MKKLLPPTLFIIFTIFMGVICWGFRFQHNIIFPLNLLGILLLLVGLAIAQINKKKFIKLETNVNTFSDPDKLITEGFFKYSRNPMYLGFVLALLGLAILYQGAVSSFILVAFFFLIFDRWYVRYEENAMLSKFGDEYKLYCQNTRRWI